MALEVALKLSFFSLKPTPFNQIRGLSNKKSFSIHAFQRTLPGSEVVDEEIMQIFLKERQTNGDFISKASDMLWRGEALKFANSETITMQENIEELDQVVENESVGAFLKLTKTHEWVSCDTVVAPVNKKVTAKERQCDSEKRRKLNLLRYEAIKRELFLLTVGIGSGCSVYCLVQFSAEAAISYAAGVICSCVYLQLLSYHVDNLSREAIPKIFLQKKLKKIGIRSEDLQDSLERTFWGSTMALSSPRLVIPATLYGIWILSQHILQNFNFQIVPAMLGFFAYKAAALVQVYRDNKDLQFVFPDSEEYPDSS